MWEKGTKGTAWITVCPCPVPDHCAVSCLLIQLSLAIFLVRVSARCARVFMEVKAAVTGGSTVGPSSQCAGMAAAGQTGVQMGILVCVIASKQQHKPAGN